MANDSRVAMMREVGEEEIAQDNEFVAPRNEKDDVLGADWVPCT